MSARRWRLAALAAAAVLALDQATKQIVTHSLAPGEHVNVFLALDLTRVRNRGVAFSALSGHAAVVVALTLAALALLVVYFARHAATPLLWLPVGAVVGGALGNLLDRVRDGAVTDFVKPTFWPAFNLADSAIVIGILGVLYVADRARAR